MNVSRYAPTVARILLGAVFAVFGLNGFLHFIPQPPPTGTAAVFLGGLAATGYMFPLIKGFEVVAGVLLLANRAVPLALLFLAPILVNIVAFHAVLAPSGVALPVVLTALTFYVAWSFREVWKPVFASRLTAHDQSARERRIAATVHAAE